MSIETKLGVHPDVESIAIGNEQIQRVSKFLKREAYHLYCAFLDASMISKTNSAIEFEVSIGNFGNKLECDPSQTSATPPAKAVYDGCHYYYLPFENNKPLIFINSQWEDISFRLHSLNILLRKLEHLVCASLIEV